MSISPRLPFLCKYALIKMKLIINIYSIILILCSVISFIGHYFQFQVIRITPWIPTSIGLFLLFINTLKTKNTKVIHQFSICIILGFGILVTSMCFFFLPEESQPIRKKIIFLIMSLSSWVSLNFLTPIKFFRKK
ncbi:hypothetical protein IWQ47_004760 [Aquimarina sp. EL_43]|nr:hypothetical protein [Aquimarina sp. EL_35]MBG6153508.1 hypothetical protein [Aquimarina sp. EL_32]MBG6171664.1 hypothetical protein [Aquimarina sp. EL_43]